MGKRARRMSLDEFLEKAEHEPRRRYELVEIGRGDRIVWTRDQGLVPAPERAPGPGFDGLACRDDEFRTLLDELDELRERQRKLEKASVPGPTYRYTLVCHPMSRKEPR